MRRLLTLAAGVAMTATSTQAQTVLSWPGKTAPVAASTAPAPLIAHTAAPGRRMQSRYSPRIADARMALASAPVPAYAPPPYIAPAAVPAPPVASYVARPFAPSPSSIFDTAIPDRGFETAPSAPVIMAAPTPAAPRAEPAQDAARAPAADGPRFYSVHREFGAQPDRAPHPAVLRGPTADPLPTGFFTGIAPREEENEAIEERPIERPVPAKPKRRSGKR